MIDRKKIVENTKNYLLENRVDKKEALQILDDIKIDVMEAYVLQGFYVLKKKNLLQKFNHDKLYNSIANASDEIGKPMTKSDIESVIKRVNKYQEETGKNLISAVKIREIVVNTLEEYGYYDISEHYEKN